MLAAKNLSLQYWNEALTTIAYVTNCSPATTVQNMTPEEAWSGKKPTVSHLRTFGCTAYMLIPKEQRKKLDNKSLKCIFVGYAPGSKAYKLYDPSTRKMHVSRDVIFAEANQDLDVSLLHFPADDAPPPAPAPIFVDDLAPSTSYTPSTQSPPSTSSSSSKQPLQFSPADSAGPSSSLSPDDFHVEVTSTKKLPKWYTETMASAPSPPAAAKRQSKYRHSTNFALMAHVLDTPEPVTFEEAVSDQKWQSAMDEEMDSILQNDTWELVELPAEKKPIDCRWIYKIKYHADGSVQRHKARLVAKGFKQLEGIDYDETFAPVANMTTVRLVLALSAQFHWPVYQMEKAISWDARLSKTLSKQTQGRN